jgi:phage terminase large subunit
VFGKIAQAGNPISREGMLYAADGPLRHLWHLIRVTGDPDDPKRSRRIDREWAAQQIATYGRENPWVQSYILGHFPPQSLNTLLTVEEVNAAMGRHLREDAYSWSQKRIGVDVARFGDDRTVLFARQGLAAFPPTIMRGVRTTDIAARIAKTIAEWGADAPDLLTLIDDTGHWGHGAVDNLLAAGYLVMPIILSDPAIDPRYRNRRAECWLTMAEWVKRGAALPPIRELVAELTEPTYTFVNGKFMLEDKDQVKRRIGRSPDLADALSLTFAIADQPAELSRGLRHRSVGKALTDFEPYTDLPKRDY